MQVLAIVQCTCLFKEIYDHILRSIRVSRKTDIWLEDVVEASQRKLSFLVP
mgnify:CR=1 FL=1